MAARLLLLFSLRPHRHKAVVPRTVVSKNPTTSEPERCSAALRRGVNVINGAPSKEPPLVLSLGYECTRRTAGRDAIKFVDFVKFSSASWSVDLLPSTRNASEQ